MLPTKLKTSKEISINSPLMEYVSNNYGNESLTQNLMSYFSDFNNKRNVISAKKEDLDTINNINSLLQIEIKYLNQLIVIQNKNIFQHLSNIEFIWTDTITGNFFSSKNIYFEYYNVLFNIASLFFLMGYKKMKSLNVDKNLRKEAIKDYKYSLYLFNIIRDEAVNKINQNELPFDLSPTYCEYCATLCIIYGQIEIVKIAEETSPHEFALRGKLLMGISESFNKAYNLSNGEPTKRGGKESYRNYLLNRSFYYKSQVYKKLSEIGMKTFDNTGKGYGEALVYEQLSVNQLHECQKSINLCDNMIEIESFNNLLSNEEKIKSIMEDLNTRVYHQFIPNPNSIKIETRILMVPLPIDNLFIKENEQKLKDDTNANCKDLELLASEEIRQMFQKYKIQMKDFINQYKNKYENENTIQSFIERLNLPKKITYRPVDPREVQSQIPPNLYQKITQIHQLGGITLLKNIMKNILNKSEELMEKLNGLMNEIINEENEDNYYRNKLGDEWVINPSNTINMIYIEKVKAFINQINQSRVYDQKENNEINTNLSYYEEIMIPKSQIEEKIAQLSFLKNELTPQELNVRNEIIKLYSLGEKIADNINNILKDTDNGVKVIPLLSSSNNLQQVFSMMKDKYIKEMEPLEEINTDIRNQMKKVTEIIPSIVDNLNFPRENKDEVSQYFDSLDKNANYFLDKLQKLRKGENYYMENEKKINNLIAYTKDWLNKRKEEKKMCLGTIRGHIAIYDPNAAKNPFDNNNQTMEYYNRSDKSDYYSPNSNPPSNSYYQNNNYSNNNINSMNNQNYNYGSNPNFQQNNNFNQNPNLNNQNNNFYYNNNSNNNIHPQFNKNNNFNDHYNPNDFNSNMGNQFNQK